MADTIPMTIEEYAQMHDAVEQAFKFFNYAPLAKRLRNAAPLRLELNIAADIISGKHKRPKHRMARPEMLRSKRRYLAVSVLLARHKGLLRKAAVADVAKEARVSVSTVHAAIRENPDLFPDGLCK